MLSRIPMTLVAVSLIGLVACGDEDPIHEPVTVEITITPDPATVGSAIEIEVEVKEGTTALMPKEVHIEFAELGTTMFTELNVEAHEDHHKAMHTFTAAGTYEVKAEAHIQDGDHEEIEEATVQLVVE